MSEKSTITPPKKPEIKPVPGKPDETVGFYFSSFIKITDPNTQEILVQKRGDI